MKILQILPELKVGGVERGTVDFAKYLIAHGHQAIVISNGGGMVSELNEAGAKHYKLPVHQKNILKMIQMIKRVRKIIQDENVQIVHARSRIPAWIAYFACRKTEASFMTTCHGYYGNHLTSQVMGWSKLVIVPSQSIGRLMIDQFKVQPENIRCIPRSVDLTRFKPKDETTSSASQCVIAIVGRLTPLKGHTYFLRAMAQVVRSIPYAKIWIIGDAPASKESYRQELETLAKRLGLEAHVQFWGNRSDVQELLRGVDILVLSSIVPEAFGRVILEAQAVGIPVVATHVGGVVDIIDDEKTGLLVAPKDEEAMAKAVIRLHRDQALVKRFVTEAREKLKNHFSLEHMASQTLKVYEELLGLTKFLVIKISSVGDVVLATASLKAIRQKFPKAKIYCLVGQESRQILQNCPYLDGLIVADFKGRDGGLTKFFKLASKLRSYHFDKIIDLQNNKRSHWLSFLSLPKESYGYDNGKWSCLLTYKVKDNRKDIPPVEHQFEVLKLLGISDPQELSLEMWLNKRDEQYVKDLLESEWLGNSQNIVGINISASEKWRTKNWPIEYIAKLCDLLSAKNIRVIITGMKKDKPLVQYLLSLTKSKPAIVVGKTDLAQLAALIKRCQVYLTPDSAPMHLAAAVQTPFIAFFGPTDSRRHLPPAKNYVVLERKLNCSPCYKTRCRILTHACMRDITPQEVVQQIESLMRQP